MYRRAVVVAVVALAAALGSPAAGATSMGSQSTSARWPVGVTVVKNSPLGPRSQPAIAVRGSRVFVVGGLKTSNGVPVRRMNDGAVYDLRTKKWTRLPNAPFKRTQTTAGLWVGPNLIVAGVVCPGPVGHEHGCGTKGVAAVYSARTKSWRRLRVPTRAEQGTLGVPTQALMSTRAEGFFLNGDTFTMAVNPRTGTWRAIPPSLLGASGSTCAAKRYAAVVGGIRPMGPAGLRLLTVRDDDWGSLVDPAGFPDPVLGGSPSCNADSVVVVRSEARATTACQVGTACSSAATTTLASTRVLRYDLNAHHWSEIPPPADMSAVFAGVGHGELVDFLAPGVPGVRLTTTTGTWMPIAPGPVFESYPPELIWALGLVVTQVRDELVVYRPV